eukprot:scaffold176564_cov29-Tisochrysis_lutea.AAC.1
MRGSYTAKYHKRHPTAPERVQWTAGVVRWNGPVGNGTWSSRAGWQADWGTFLDVHSLTCRLRSWGLGVPFYKLVPPQAGFAVVRFS